MLLLITAYNNPLLDEYNKSGLRRLTKEPKEHLPPLLELSARAVYNHCIKRNVGSIPRELEGALLEHSLLQLHQTVCFASSPVICQDLLKLWRAIFLPFQVKCLLLYSWCISPCAITTTAVFSTCQCEMQANSARQLT